MLMTSALCLTYSQTSSAKPASKSIATSVPTLISTSVATYNVLFQSGSMPEFKPVNEVNRLFNLGYKTLLNVPELQCTCGKPWTEGKQPTICVACANATCSDECHLEHIQEKEHCLMYTNFKANDELFEVINGFRSILYKNFTQLGDGMQLNFASPRFMAATRHDSKHISLQRGFRQYGQPLEATLKHMKVIEESPTFEHRLCDCRCTACAERPPHPVTNCAAVCHVNKQMLRLAYIECWCVCSHCILRGAHSRMECMHNCKTHSLT
mmetsp:Transcript_3507/g.7277  ORF Transcript_3507/g.7277 Transcript_3507/m.7277 type:complete len:267 (+) Transcript_3507:61-861(+)